ncbi:SUMF1/EgtB/PvdO family nonheme iron enzyme [Candidatus Latescibacterota bacterium]
MLNRSFGKSLLPEILLLLALCLISSCSKKDSGNNVVDPVEDEVPGTPILYDPGESVYSGDTYTLEWASADFAKSYIIEISGNSEFYDVKNVYTATNTSRDFTKEVTTTRLLFFRVKAVNGSKKSPSWSNVVDLKVINKKPALNGPGNTLLTRNNFDFTWTDAGYSSYILEEADNDAFINIIQHQTTDLSYSFTRTVPEKKTLYFRVRGDNGDEESEWSDTVMITLYNLLHEFFCELVPIPAGSFLLGHPDDPRSKMVMLSAFYMTSKEITNGLYNAVVNKRLATLINNSKPVVDIEWYEATRFCNLLSETESLESCYDESTWECDFSKNGYRLPTEAEWECACKAGTTTWYYSGDNEQDLDRVAWYLKNSHARVESVGGREPNNFGLYDMLGNAEEWVNDWHDDNYDENTVDPTGPKTGDKKVIRGGSVESYYHGCTSYARHGFAPDDHASYDILGFRVVRR